MTHVITAHEATIQTATVAIQTLRVGKKQVTMGMFRQLPYRHFVDWNILAICCADEDDEEPPCSYYPHLDGKMWGHVNYWWAGDDIEDVFYTNAGGSYSPGGAHRHGGKRHVVWQSVDDEASVLYRCIVCERIPTWVIQQCGHEHKMRFLWACYWERLCKLPQLFIAV
jgi:hypothetical protein